MAFVIFGGAMIALTISRRGLKPQSPV